MVRGVAHYRVRCGEGAAHYRVRGAAHYRVRCGEGAAHYRVQIIG